MVTGGGGVVGGGLVGGGEVAGGDVGGGGAGGAGAGAAPDATPEELIDVVGPGPAFELLVLLVPEYAPLPGAMPLAVVPGEPVTSVVPGAPGATGLPLLVGAGMLTPPRAESCPRVSVIVCWRWDRAARSAAI